MTRKLGKILTLGLMATMLSFVISMQVGPSGVGILGYLTGNEDALKMLSIRFQRTLLAFSVGMVLGSTGAAYQGMLQNPLADPYLLGISGGAALGTAIAVGLELPSPLIPLIAFFFATAATVFIFAVSSRRETKVLLLTGVVFNAFAFALILFLNSILSQKQVYEMLFFLVGSVDYASWAEVTTCLFLSLIGTAIITCAGRALDAASFGDEHAKALGIKLESLRAIVFVTSSLMVGASVAAAGMIGFVGLFIPHIARLLAGAGHRVLIPTSAILGASFLTLADTLARSGMAYTYLGGELPVGVITALVGAPLFFWLMQRTTLTQQ